MTSFDTNLLLYSLNKDCPEYNAARAFSNALPTARPHDNDTPCLPLRARKVKFAP